MNRKILILRIFLRKTTILRISIILRIRIFVNTAPGCTPTSRGVVFVEKYYSGYQSEKLVPANLPSTHAHSSIFAICHFKTSNIARRHKKRVKYKKINKMNMKYVAYCYLGRNIHEKCRNLHIWVKSSNIAHG